MISYRTEFSSIERFENPTSEVSMERQRFGTSSRGLHPTRPAPAVASRHPLRRPTLVDVRLADLSSQPLGDRLSFRLSSSGVAIVVPKQKTTRWTGHDPDVPPPFDSSCLVDEGASSDY